MTDNIRFFLPIVKVDKDAHTVSGYASTATKDMDGEIISVDAVKKALPGYMEWRNIREMHRLSAVGKALEAHTDANGLFLTAKIVDDKAWKKCLEGVYSGFSIGGRKLAKVGDTITDIELTEISVVDRPANPDCRITVAKSAKTVGDAEAHLLKIEGKDPMTRALRKMAEAVQLVTKAGPPAAHDGFSLPAPGKNPSPRDVSVQNNKTSGEDDGLCKHGLKIDDCAKCISKRDFSAEQRREAATSGAALPDGSFPIKNQSDLDNAVRLVGHAKKPEKAKAHITSRALSLGLKLPDSWGTKVAKATAVAQVAPAPSFLTLGVAGAIAGSPPSVPGVKGDVNRRTGFLELDTSLRKRDDSDNSDIDDTLIQQFLAKDTSMTTDNTNDLGTALLNMVKRAAMPTRAMRLAAADDNMKKARDARKECTASIKAAHGVLKAAYIAKAAKKKPEPDEDADDPMEKAMVELNKAFTAIGKVGTFSKAAREQLKKAAGRSGQRGQETSDPEAGFYEVPTGVKDLTPSAMSGAAPGTSGGGSQPPMYPVDGSTFPGKAASASLRKYVGKDGRVPVEIAELVAENQALTARGEALARLPISGARPHTFDVSRLAKGAGGNERDMTTKLMEGVDPVALVAENDDVSRVAKQTFAGNYILNFGKSITDPSFRGGAGSRRSA